MPCGLAGLSAFPPRLSVVRCCHNSDMLCDGIPRDCNCCVSPRRLYSGVCSKHAVIAPADVRFGLSIAYTTYRVRAHTTNRPREGGTTRGRRVWRAISERVQPSQRQIPVSAGERSGLRDIQCRHRRFCLLVVSLCSSLGWAMLIAHTVSHTIEALRLIPRR
jgi:hypothetical protein